MRPSDLQVTYQRNSFIALAAVCLLSALCAITIQVLGGQDGTTVVRGWRYHPVVDLGSGGDRSEGTGGNPYLPQPTGFVGFHNLNPTTYTPDVTTTRQQDPTVTVGGPLGDGGNTLLSGGSGDGWEKQLAALTPILNPHFATYEPEPDHDVTVLYHVEPEYPEVARQDGDEGKVTLLVYIDSVGRLTSFPDWIVGKGIKTRECLLHGRPWSFDYFAREESDGEQFTEDLIEVLPLWLFSPRIEDGVAVAAPLRIKCDFCIGEGCFRLEYEEITIRPRS